MLLAAVACTGSGSADGGIEGIVLLGPTCPVQRLESPCPDRPYRATLRIIDAGGDEVATIVTGEDGRFRLELSAGRYVIEPVLAQSPPMGTPTDVIVESGRFASVTIRLDSGIR